ncbi:hypothetical protein INS49_008585 [Diaporthe citri]|uniref:uncharacterized protein n=1 Tax=Diaporthe citri TaxID=83186 RepID=UPI001C7E51EF|nr:uncharacterized protein INS49_008585 [Diaporthe citri]KAG6363485.1 hypothetical protein INS49_008585 [Diaporthe citri]
MATPVISRPTAVDSSPLLTIGDEKPDKGGRVGQATKLSTALGQATADQQDTSDSDDQDLEGEKKLEVQADKIDSDNETLEDEKEFHGHSHAYSRLLLMLPLLILPPMAPSVWLLLGPRPAASTKHGTGSTKTQGTDAKKQQKGASDTASRRADAGSETAAADAGAHDKSRLPFRRNKNGPRKGGKQKEKGALGRAYEKLKMGLFSKKKKEPVDENPYSAPITPYQQARNDLHQQKLGGPGGPGAPGGLPSNPRMNSFASSTAPPPYQSPSVASDNSRFGDEKFGNQNGYGSNRYDNDNAAAFSANQRRPGGYGGFGDDAGSNELFGGASSRYVPPQQGGAPSVQSPPNGSAPFRSTPSRYDNDPSKGTLLGNAQDRYNPLPPTARQEGAAEDDEYGGYGAPREMTEEEREREDVRATNAQTREIRKAGIDSLARSRALGEQALGLAASSAARLGEQDNRLARTERNVDAALVMSRNAEKSTKELKTINDSMFSGMFGPSKRTLNKRDAETLAQYQEDKEARESTAKSAYKSEQQMEDMFKDINGNKPSGPLGARRNNAERSKFIFKDDESDDELAREDENDEDQINEGIDDLTDIVGKLKGAAIGMGGNLTTQNERLDRLAGKTDAVDDRVRMNREKLSRIR